MALRNPEWIGELLNTNLKELDYANFARHFNNLAKSDPDVQEVLMRYIRQEEDGGWLRDLQGF